MVPDNKSIHQCPDGIFDFVLIASFELKCSNQESPNLNHQRHYRSYVPIHLEHRLCNIMWYLHADAY